MLNRILAAILAVATGALALAIMPALVALGIAILACSVAALYVTD